jgi:hypothetical protein
MPKTSSPRLNALTSAYGLNDAGKIDPEHGRQWLARVRRLSRPNLQIERVDPTSFDANQHLIRARDGSCNFC